MAEVLQAVMLVDPCAVAKGAVAGLLLILPVCAWGFEWPTASPETQGMSAAKLEALGAGLAAHNTKALLIIRNDRIVYEWYAPDCGRSKRHYTASLAKAIVGGVSLMLALDDDLLHPDDLACSYVTSWRDDPLKSKITIRHLATHSSGIEDAEEEGRSHEELTGWKGDFWKRSPNPFLTARDEAPVIFEPGSDLAYSNPGMAMLSYCVAAALGEAGQPDIKTLLTDRVMDPIGVPREEWSMSYGQTFELDGLTLHANWGGGGYSPNAVARVGRLMLRNGDWDGERLVSPEAVELATADAKVPTPDRSEGPRPRSGLCWWLNSDGLFPRVPRDAFFGSGAGNQLLVVIPSLDLIVVRNGSAIGGDPFWGPVQEHLLDPLMDAIIELPLPRSKVIQGVTFAPVNEIVRSAEGSDNWPIAWGDDDMQYTAYGDGWGFDLATGPKLSQGFARIIGGPDHFVGANIPSATGQRLGDGAQGPKASGMLMVDGVLYLLVRNLGNSQLAWSEDHGRTWPWGFRFDTSFGCPTFLSFGSDYQGARDEHVYVYSSDGPTAYESHDQVVLARVPKHRIRERDAYEFLVRVGDGEPVWSDDITRRGPLLAYPGHCGRLDVAYNPGVGRYLMALGYHHQGGWGVFDAPQPWGPWTTVFHTPSWDVGNTHSYRLPTRWISADGQTMHVVFSGREHAGVDYDAFCVRRMDLHLAVQENP